MPRTIDTAAIAYHIERFQPMVELLVRSSPWGGDNKVQVDLDPTNPSVRVTLSTPCTQPLTITAEVKWGSDWTVEVSGWSWKIEDVDQIGYAADVMRHAATIARIIRGFIAFKN